MEIKNAEKSPLEILLIDDDADYRELLQEMIEEQGHRGVLAENIREAESHLTKNRIDVVICDYIMPDLDGLTVLDRLRPKYQGPLYVLASGLNSRRLEEVTLEKGYLYFPKQMVLAHFDTTIRRIESAFLNHLPAKKTEG